MRDHELRKRIRREKSQEQLPKVTETKINKLLEQLPEEPRGIKTRRFFRNAIVFAAVLSLSTVTVFAGAKLVTLGRGTLKSSNGTKQYRNFVRSTEIKNNNGEANISKTDKGITLTIENIGLDEGNLILYYNVTTKGNPIKSKKDDLKQRWNLNNIWLSPKIMINGKQDDTINETGVTEAYKVNEHKIKGIYRFNLSGKLEQKVKLEIVTNYLWEQKGDWTINLDVDRSKIENKAKVITKKNGTLTDQIVLSPLGNTLRSTGKKQDLVIKDDHGRYLYWILRSHDAKKITQFFMNSKDTKTLNIIPIKKQYVLEKNGKVQKASIKLRKGQIVKVSDHTKLKIKAVKKQKHSLRIYFKVLNYDGAILTDGLENHFVEDKNKKSLDKDFTSIDTWTDYEKEQLVLEFYNASKGVDYRKAAKINFLKQKTVLDEKNKQTIKLK